MSPKEHACIEAANLLTRGGLLSHFMGTNQRAVLFTQLAGEEAEGIAKLVIETAEKIRTMPKTYEQDGKGDDAVVHLHYFMGSIDAWVTERDMGAVAGSTEIGEQLQAFGFMNLGDPENAELGYISIKEMIEAGVELDLYWGPKTLAEVKKGLQA
jgi:hypothetical protein